MSIESFDLGRDQEPRRIFFSPKEVQAILGLSHATVYRLITAGKLDARKLGNKTLISRASIQQLAAQLPAARVRAAG